MSGGYLRLVLSLCQLIATIVRQIMAVISTAVMFMFLCLLPLLFLVFDVVSVGEALYGLLRYRDVIVIHAVPPPPISLDSGR